MIIKWKVNEESPLDQAIDEATRTLDPNADDYLKMISALERLTALKKQESSKWPGPDTIATIAGNLVGIWLILHYEEIHVLTSKALNFVIKLK
jgi:hypothetical protein